MALNETNFIEGVCENPNCEDHMIAKRYPTRLEYVWNLTVVMYQKLTPQCPKCNSFLRS